MTDFNSAFLQIKTLVETFKQNESKFLSTSYQEADVRNDFINKFFIALGWDVRHEHQLNPYEQEVKVEKPVLIASQQKRADYAFFIDPNYRDVKFFAEAKKPSRNLFNKDDYFQTCRYGWNAGTPIAVLTDFEEFHILDCRFKPDINTILENKIERFHYSDYLDKEKLSKIYYLFSREAVENNSLEKFADSLPKPRGKAAKKVLVRGGYQSIDESFLEELDEIRLSLAKAFKNNNPELNSDELTEMTQRTIDRLVFIRFLEDKIIEPDDYIGKFSVSKKPWEDFISASRTFDAKYNGIVFKKHKIDTNTFLEPDEKIFSSICNNLAHNNAPYNFDQIPIHILGSIYERFLGKIVVATDKRVRIDDKPEVRKAGGVYYTPQYIVNYIVDNTVGKLIEGKEPKEIAKMRFADISCGSGSFLITVFDRLLDYHKKWYQKNPKQAKKDGCHLDDGKWVLSLKQKQNILTNNIYGVDIDHQAVEVTQLSLYLKLLEDETTATANDTWVMFKEKLLPSLNKNIICGNSLIGTDIFEGTLFEYEEEKNLKPMNFEDAFPDIMKNGGFDAIVGNPPYRMMQPHNTDKNILDYYKNNYEITEFKIDLFHLFTQRGTKLINRTGYLGYIIPSSILNNVYVEKLRLWLLNNVCINKISLTKEKVFDGADVYTAVFIFKKEADGLKRNNNLIQKTIELEQIKMNHVLNYTQVKQSRYYETDGKIWNLLLDEQNVKIIDKIKSSKNYLVNLATLNRGLITGDKQKYFSLEKVNEKYIPILEGADVFRYYSNHPSNFVLFKKPKTAGGCWDSDVHLAEHKILIRQIGKEPTATFLNKKYAVTGNIFTIMNENIEVELFILSIINSTLIKYFWQIMFSDFKNSFPQVTIYSLSQIPIPKVSEIDKSIFNLFVKVSNQMLESKKKLQEAKTESEKEYLENKCNTIDKQIDNLVYELYGLTDDEIKIVERN